MNNIYLDNASSMPCFDSVANSVKQLLCEEYFNPSAEYCSKGNILQEISNSRQILAQTLSVNEQEIYFMSGATEANNLAIFSGFKNKKGRLVTTVGEHPSVYNSAMQQRNRGLNVEFVGLNSDGTVNLDMLFSRIDENTALVSVIHVNNESGAINDIGEIFARVKRINPSIVTHSDGVQAFCKCSADLSNVDIYTISAHKIGGLKGVGAVRIRSGLNLMPLIFGGGQERGVRAGTENTVAIATFGQAVRAFTEKYDFNKMCALRDAFIEEMQGCKGFCLLSGTQGAPNIIVLSTGVRAQTMQSILSDNGIFVGIGSACSAKNRDNRVLKAMGYSQRIVDGALRVSLSPFNTAEEVKFVAKKIGEIADSL